MQPHYSVLSAFLASLTGMRFPIESPGRWRDAVELRCTYTGTVLRHASILRTSYNYLGFIDNRLPPKKTYSPGICGAIVTRQIPLISDRTWSRSLA